MEAQHDLRLEQAAGVVYSMIDAYNVLVDGDDPRPPWTELSQENQQKVIESVAAIALERDLTPADNHAAWVEGMEERGWTLDGVLDHDDKTHPNLVAFEDLPIPAQRMAHAMHGLACTLLRPIEEINGDTDH